MSAAVAAGARRSSRSLMGARREWYYGAPMRCFAFALLALALACGDDDAPAPVDAGALPDAAAPGEDAATSVDAGPTLPRTIGGDRPAAVRVPIDYDPAEPAALIVLLHGFGASGVVQDAYLGLSGAARTRNTIVVLPDGTENPSGQRYWNATDACCDFEGTEVDDVAYVRSLVSEVQEHYAVDPDRIYLFGHSNGGFMSYHLACEGPDPFAAIATLAGATWNDPANCTPERPLSVLQIHGTADETIAYEGGIINAAVYPSAAESVAFFAEEAGCDAEPVEGERFDFTSDVDGAETVESVYEGCGEVDVRLWTLEAGGHIPVLADGAIERVVDWLLAQSR
ncbi:MAG: hypothetical protein CMN31_16225 [Sandaracinus sp.]|nr:hypothetical protein [Sandaracinus sp.]MBJ72857.1 hypothetical protein [Sandaracinus sp.]